jgi:uncharacterized protein (DUF1501 family)
VNEFDLHRDRRAFIKSISAMASLPLLGGVMQAANAAGPFDDYRALVVLFLYGGADNHNMIIPLGSDYAAYSRARSNLAIPQDNVIPITAGVSGRSFGMHPNLRALSAIFNNDRKLAFVNNVGVLVEPTTLAAFQQKSKLPPQLFSHSDMVNHTQTSRPDSPSDSGWGGRLADLIESANGNAQVSTSISVSGQTIFQKGRKVRSYSLHEWTGADSVIVNRPRAYGYGDNWSAMRSNPQMAYEALLATAGTNLLEMQYKSMAKQAVNVGDFLNSVLYNVDTNGNPVRGANNSVTEKFPVGTAPPINFVDSRGLTITNKLASQFKSAASLIAARNAIGVKRQIFFVSLGGFDTHGDQFKDSNNATTPILSGRHADLLQQVDEAVSWFYNWTKSAGIANSVTLATLSDFGRTLISNGAGSDHGWGGHNFVLGGAVNGGKFYGGPEAGQEFPIVALGTQDDVGQGRLLPTTSIDEYGATLAKWMGASNSELTSVFPNLSRFPRQTGLGFL